MAWELPWIIGGDFNIVLYLSERLGTMQDSACMREFRELVNDLALVDLPLVGGCFTWSNIRESTSCSRINRFLVSLEWEALVVPTPLT